MVRLAYEQFCAMGNERLNLLFALRQVLFGGGHGATNPKSDFLNTQPIHLQHQHKRPFWFKAIERVKASAHALVDRTNWNAR